MFLRVDVRTEKPSFQKPIDLEQATTIAAGFLPTETTRLKHDKFYDGGGPAMVTIKLPKE